MGSRRRAGVRRRDRRQLVLQLRELLDELEADDLELIEEAGDYDRDELGLDPEEDDECRG